MFMIRKLPAVLVRPGVFLLLSLSSAFGGELDGLLGWTKTFLQSVRQDSTPPAQVSRRLAILFLAARDAQDLARDPFYPATPEPPSPIDPSAAAIGALSAGAQIFYPSHKTRYRDHLESFKKLRLDEGLSNETLQASLAYGKEVVFHAIKQRADDGATNTLTYIPSDVPGHWRRTPPRYRPPELSHWGAVRPFVLESAAQFRPPPPPALDSAEYRKALEEVRQLGGQDDRHRPEKGRETAQFWSCFSYTSTPSGHWTTILIDLLESRPDTSLDQALDAFFILNVTLADTAIACWEAKYHYNFWRPEDAIRHSLDADWKPLLESPPHPEYVSGHSSFAGSGSRILELLFGTDALQFEARSDSVPGVVRRYKSLTECAAEMGRSRILGGIHYPFSDREGQQLGRSVADYCWNQLGKPKVHLEAEEAK